MWTLCGGSSASLQSSSISSHQASVIISWCVKVMCDRAPMSFHSSFHFKALYMLAQCDEVWISFLPLPLSNLSQSARTTCPGCSYSEASFQVYYCSLLFTMHMDRTSVSLMITSNYKDTKKMNEFETIKVCVYVNAYSLQVMMGEV